MEAFSSDSRAGKSKGLKTYEGKRNRGGSKYEESDEETNLLEPLSQKSLKRRATTGPEPTPSDDLMLPPILANRGSQQGKGSGSVSSTIPNTSLEPPRSVDPATALPSTSSGRMTTPTISTGSPHNLSAESAGRAEELKDEVKKDEQQPSSYAAVPTKTMTEVLIESRNPGSSYETRDELALPPSTHKHPSSPPSKGRSKRKLSVGTYTDELGSDDFTVGLPKERYQPRPSRSRTDRTVDDSVLAIDYSKRPEAVARKIKRRKTTGTQVGMEDERDQEPFDFPTKTMDGFEISPIVIGEDVVPPKHMPKKFCDAEGLVEPLDEGQVSVREAVPAKKKRGRPKKQVEQDIEEKQVEQDFKEKPLDNFPAGPVAATAETAEASTAPVKKSRKRRKTTEEALAISKEIVDEDDELTTMGEHGDNFTANVLEANVNAANVRSGPSPTADEPQKPTEPTDEEGSVPGHNTTPVETPKKETAKGSNKHSPLNTSRVRYRVGLSKRVRVEPLLKVVRK
jgi:hypothetical protein